MTQAGGVFEFGYPVIDTSGSNVLRGRAAFTGTNAANGFPVEQTGQVEVLQFGDTLNGQQVRLRFRVLTDEDTARQGWRIDNVSFNNVISSVFSDVIAGNDSLVQCDSLPIIRVDNASIEIAEDTTGEFTATVFNRNNPNADISYTWRQIGGPAVQSTTGDNTPNFSFVPSPVEQDTTLTFELEVSDGVASSLITVVATVSSTESETPPPPPPAPASDSGSGGGSLFWLFALMPIVLIRRLSK